MLQPASKYYQKLKYPQRNTTVTYMDHGNIHQHHLSGFYSMTKCHFSIQSFCTSGNYLPARNSSYHWNILANEMELDLSMKDNEPCLRGNLIADRIRLHLDLPSYNDKQFPTFHHRIFRRDQCSCSSQPCPIEILHLKTKNHHSSTFTSKCSCILLKYFLLMPKH